MKVIIGSDHAGLLLKNTVKEHLTKQGHEVKDLGTDSDESTDYPDYAKKVAEQVLEEQTKGILVCGTGIGMSMAANKVKGIRAAVCHSHYTAKVAREHNNANILCMGGRTTDPDLANEMADLFLTTTFSDEERHHRRVDKIES